MVALKNNGKQRMQIKGVIMWAVKFAAGKNYHTFEMEYAMNFQQLSTCLLDKDLQFGT